MTSLEIKNLEEIERVAHQIYNEAQGVLPHYVAKMDPQLKGAFEAVATHMGEDIGKLAQMVQYLAKYVRELEVGLKNL